MSSPGSAPLRSALPLVYAPLAILMGVVAMWACLGLAAAAHLGTRPTLVAAESLIALPGIVLLAFFGIPLRAGLGLAPVSARTAALAAVAGVTLWALGLGIMQLQAALFPPPPEYLELFRRLHEALRPRDPLDEALSVLAIAVMPGLCEELLFRGVVLPSLRPRLGAAGAVLGAAALFALIHVDWTPAGPVLLRVPFALAVGAGFGALRVRSGSLLCPMLAHAVLNTITFEAARLVEDQGAAGDPQVALGAVLLLAGLAATGLVLRALPGVVDAPEARA